MRIAFGQSFDVPEGYFNTASIGIPPKAAVDGLMASVGRWQSGQDVASVFDADVRVARGAWGSLIGVDESRVACGTSVSQLVGLVAASVPDGTRVLVADGEFTSVSFPLPRKRIGA